MKTLFIILIIALIGCKTNNFESRRKNKMHQDVSSQLISGPKALVYKTKVNYDDLVPVLMSEDKSVIISYPHPRDIQIADKFQLPTKLHHGYLLDNRGIGLNVGFLKLTYEEYSKLQEVPPIKELYNMIIDKDPLSELYDCGNKNAFLNLVNHLNDLIDNNKLSSEAKKIK
jgi:hypothetical protein